MQMWKLAADRSLEWQKRADPTTFVNVNYKGKSQVMCTL